MNGIEVCAARTVISRLLCSLLPSLLLWKESVYYGDDNLRLCLPPAIAGTGYTREPAVAETVAVAAALPMIAVLSAEQLAGQPESEFVDASSALWPGKNT